MSVQTDHQTKGENKFEKVSANGVNGIIAPPPLSFESLNESIYVYRPPVNNFKRPLESISDIQRAKNGLLSPIHPKRANANLPRIVLIMGWMDAPLRFVSKYAAPYALLFPTATIIIKLSDGISFMRGRKSQAEVMGKVADLLCEAEASDEAKASLRKQSEELQKTANQVGLTLSEDVSRDKSGLTNENKTNVGGMIVHNFSDGGSANLLQLLLQLRDRNAPQPLAHIMDSSPGKATPYSGASAMTMPLAKRPMIRAIIRTGVYIYLYFFAIIKRFFRVKGWSEVMRERLNTPAIWTWGQRISDQKSKSLPPRLYLYSKADKLIDFRAVEEHAALAAKANRTKIPIRLQDLEASRESEGSVKSKAVVTKRWEDVAHCDIGRADFDGYWKSVRTFLENTL